MKKTLLLSAALVLVFLLISCTDSKTKIGEPSAASVSSEKEANYDPSVPSETQTELVESTELPADSLPVTPLDIDLTGKTIVYSADGIGINNDEVLPPGTVKLLGSLNEKLEAYDGQDVLFAVRIEVLEIWAKLPENKKKDFVNERENMMEEARLFCDTADYFNMMAEFEEWRKNENGTSEENETALFEAFLDSIHEKGLYEKEEHFRWSHSEAERLYSAAEQWIPDYLRDEIENEYDRLVSNGLLLDGSRTNENTFSFSFFGFLTAEQITEFPVDPSYSYCIYLAEENPLRPAG